jgi:hypothetical protein
MIKTNRKKLKTVQNTINENANKLNVLKTQNNLHQTEIENLQKVINFIIFIRFSFFNICFIS